MCSSLVGAVVSVLLLASGCASARLNEFYTLDARAMDIPVMLNERPADRSGRAFEAMIRQTTQQSSQTFGSIAVVRRVDEHTRVTAQDQIAARLSPRDSVIYLTDVMYRRFAEGMAGDSFSGVFLRVSALYYEERSR